MFKYGYKMTSFQFLLGLLTLWAPPTLSQSDAVGRVFIGTSENDTTQIYSFNWNFEPAALTIPVFLTLTNDTTGEPINMDETVSVTCGLNPSGEIGFSYATFQTIVIYDVGVVDDVPFGLDNGTYGRSTVIQCWGESSQHFTKESSISDNYSFEIRPPGTINVFNPLVVIPNRPLNQYTQMAVLLELSDNPSSGVFVSCSLNTQGITDPLNVVFLPRVMAPGQQRFMMPYNVTSKGNPVPFNCTASSNATVEIQFVEATSTGDTSVMMIAEGLATLSPEVTTLRATSMNAFLVLDMVPVTATTFYCTIATVNSTYDANDIAADSECRGPDIPPAIPTSPSVTGDGNDTTSEPTQPPTATPSPPTGTPDPTTGSPPGPTPSTNQTGEWKLEETEFIFEPDQVLFKQLSMYRTQEVVEFTEEIIVTHCCAPENLNPSSPQFVNVSATMMTFAFTTPAQPINWTSATALPDLNVPTPILNPGFVNVAPCPCDLREGACDTDCCCDELCTQSELDTFNCIPGVEGGFPPPPARYNCDVRYPLQNDWFPFLCVQFDNTAFLGYYFFDQTLLRSQSAINAALNAHGSPFTFAVDPTQVPQAPSGDYREGMGVDTGIARDTLEINHNIGPNYRLTLPARTWTGRCVWSSPVQFLVDNDEECVHAMKEQLCNNESPLNALNFAQSSLWSGQSGAEVLRQRGTQVITETDVNYHCAGDNPEYTARYIKSLTTLDEVMPPDEVFLFDYALPVNEDNETDCYFSASTGAFVCVNQSEAEQAPAVSFPPRCGFDDGFTRPPAPFYDEVTNTCMNAAVEVNYDFVWSGQEILYLNATVVLANIPLELERVTNVTIRYTNSSGDTLVNETQEFENVTTEITQIFSTKFSSYPTVVEINDTTVENLTESRSGRYMRSGNPGYEYDLPVITATEIFNDTDGDFLYFDANNSQRISLWDVSSAGLCMNSGSKVAPFGQNTMSSCIVRMSAADLDDCDNLRKLILNRQDNMMPSSFISIGGDPSLFNTNDWTRIFREDISSTLNMTIEVPYTTEADFNYTTMPITDTTPVETSALFPFAFADPGNASSPYLDSVTGRCPNIASGIVATIMYAEVGVVNSAAIYQIVGANINYTLSTWQMFCAGVLGGACYGNESYVDQDGTIKIQSFALSTAVNFIKVPAQAPTPMTEYEQRNYVPAYVCKSDSCWRELFYPWTGYNLGDQETYALIMGLLFIIYGIGLVLITRPISRWG